LSRPAPARPTSALGPLLERLYVDVDVDARRAADPVRFAHRYTAPEDREVAAVLAASLAFGRVAAFSPVLERLFAIADTRGGPRAWVDGFEPAVDRGVLDPVYYRWNRGIDWTLLIAALHRLYRQADSLEAHLVGERLPDALDHLVGALRDAAVAEAGRCGVEARTFDDLPRSFRTLLPRPADGSATKRWWMFLRWMVRSRREGIDLGLWATRRPAELVVPLDTHVLRLSRFLGLTARTDGSLRTALEVTDRLRDLDPEDPVRFDFALAHLGISGACKGYRHATVCPTCPLHTVCVA
jgi:uncharacterized protein (TIGR02757 family)